jgi:Sec-independent protein translocase protein TatA
LAGAVGISLLLIGVGVLLLLGPGRLIPSYHRKH